MDAEYAAAYPQLYRRHWWWRVREWILLQKIRTMLGDRHDARILDVGCGAGLFFDALRPFGRVEGIESDADTVARSGAWRSHIVVGELDDAYRPSAPFDLILMLDVLEHLDDAGALVCRAARLLAPGGHILVTVPAYRWLWTAHDDLNHHVTRYTAGAVRRVFEQSGVTPAETGYIFQSLVVAKLLVKLTESGRPRSRRVPELPAPAINRAVQAWFRLEYRILGWLPFGGSVLAVGARRAAG